MEKLAMGFMARLMGIPAKKENLIRRLLATRIEQDPASKNLGKSSEYAAQLPITELMGMPEATVVTCVETWSQLRARGMDDTVICVALANHRGVVVPPSSLFAVFPIIMEIVQNEHGHSGYLPEDHVRWCIDEARMEYGIKLGNE